MIMINIELIDFKRAIMHEIVRKTNQSHAMSICAEKLLTLEDDVIKTLKDRLNIAFGRMTRCFEMNFANIAPGSFYELCKDLKFQEDQTFIENSKLLANLLANSQNKKIIPGGYFLFIEGVNRVNNTSIYIAIKADLQEALSKDKNTGAISVIKEVFLSPAQRFYKVGLMIEKDNETQPIDPNERFACFLFDEQFNASEAIPATYFFKDFLGFSEDKNTKIVTKRYYDQTSSFINTNFPDIEERLKLLNALKVNLVDSNNRTFDPTEFGRSYIADLDKRNLYSSTILSLFPSSFIKDTTLLDTVFKHSSMYFPNKIKISGPSTDFNTHVSILKKEELKHIDDLSEEYTILLVKGKPQRNV